MDRLAAIVALHSHFDHAMDIGMVANRTAAVVLGSESTANVARGSDVPVSQYQILADGETRQFGNFTITLIESRHAPIGIGGQPGFPGNISEPLEQPARIRDWKDGGAWSVLISHPQGTALVQGSAGFVEGALSGKNADVAMLGVGGLSSLGKDYVAQYWQETVVRTGAMRVYPIHYEDFTKPLGELQLFPDIVDEVVVTARWIDELAADKKHPVSVSTLPFGQPVAIFP
jgi:L-ascorbate metabolism protein UlaG (beta-lactamase superfamily)